MLRYRILTAIVAIPLLIWFILDASAFWFATLILGATFIALREFAEMAVENVKYGSTLTVGGGMIIALAMGTLQSGVAISAGVVVALCGTLIVTLAFAEEMQASVDGAARIMLGALYAGILLPHFIWLRALPEHGPYWVFFTVAVVMAGDVGGYFGGRRFGRTLLWPSVSPNKTVEGATAGLAASILCGLIVNATLLGAMGTWEVMAVSAVAGGLGQLGDLLESMLKRAFDAKDSGWILPGHGGVLDRTDSLVLPAVYVYYYAVLTL